MKTCKNCGAENFGAFTECSKCKFPLDFIIETNEYTPPAPPVPQNPVYNRYSQQPVSHSSGLKTAAKIFLIILTVSSGFALLLGIGFFIISFIAKNNEYLILAWILQSVTIFSFVFSLCMTVSYSRKIYERQPVSVGFKICTLLFLSPIAGILMLCDNQ